MERSYPKRYNRPRVDRHKDLIAERLGDVVVEGEMAPDRAESLRVDDASGFARCLTDDPRGSTAGARADVVYIDEEFGVLRFSGPVGGANRIPSPPTEPWDASSLATPLPALLWRTGVEPGVWVAVPGHRLPGGEKDPASRLVRVTERLPERGRELSEDLGEAKAAGARDLGSNRPAFRERIEGEGRVR